MPDPNLTIPAGATPAWVLRYTDWRARRYTDRMEKASTMLPGLRNRRARRILVAVLAGCLAVAVGSAIAAFWHTAVMAAPFTAGLTIAVVAFVLLRITSDSPVDAPADALDELQLAQRNAARSLAYTLFVPVMLVVYAVAITLSLREYVAGPTLGALAWLLISGTLAVTCLPDMLLTWWRPDDDVDAAAPTGREV
ncbi:MAG: hypothetical protein QM809_00835 [Gordonia sp. (in: high G+C Gram-positive bacteria)]|uniref:hypothetical protein n=1 Tax=Gordonia sp. (in: high G+C Gram-positive bacteria) TaxID=84139 RepID=UPI0039E21DFA